MLLQTITIWIWKRIKEIQTSTAPKQKKRLIVYDRDIILLPETYMPDKGSDGKIMIPRREREYLASHSIIGKITLASNMSQDDIYDEILEVFKIQMNNNMDFQFTVLQPTGGGSKSLIVPALSKNFTWTASSIAGKNARSSIYILANESMKVNCIGYLK